MNNCLDDETIQSLLGYELTAQDVRRVVFLLAACESCAGGP